MANNFLGGLFGDSRGGGMADMILLMCLFCCMCGNDGVSGRGGLGDGCGDGCGDIILPLLLLMCCCSGGSGRRGRRDGLGLDPACDPGCGSCPPII